MKLPEFLTEAPYGEIRLTGSRIGLYHVAFYHNRGLSVEGLHALFPSLHLDLIRKTIAYYEQNRAAVDAYMARCEAESESARKATKPFDAEELERRLREKGVDVDAMKRRIQTLDRPEAR